jgi:transposase InsO family protein
MKAGLVHHSDRGVQYAVDDYTGLLAQYGIQISMSRKGNSYDNARTESFMKTLNMRRSTGRNIAICPMRFVRSAVSLRRSITKSGYTRPWAIAFRV